LAESARSLGKHASEEPERRSDAELHEKNNIKEVMNRHLGVEGMTRNKLNALGSSSENLGNRSLRR
jgi:hypothetical protein